MLARFKSRAALQMAAVNAVLLAAMADANAALPTGVSTAVTAIGDDATAVFDLVVPVVLSVLGLVVVIKLIKRFTNKI